MRGGEENLMGGSGSGGEKFRGGPNYVTFAFSVVDVDVDLLSVLQTI